MVSGDRQGRCVHSEGQSIDRICLWSFVFVAVLATTEGEDQLPPTAQEAQVSQRPGPGPRRPGNGLS